MNDLYANLPAVLRNISADAEKRHSYEEAKGMRHAYETAARLIEERLWKEERESRAVVLTVRLNLPKGLEPWDMVEWLKSAIQLKGISPGAIDIQQARPTNGLSENRHRPEEKI